MCVLLRNTAFLAWKHILDPLQSHSALLALIEEELVDKECLSREQAS